MCVCVCVGGGGGGYFLGLFEILPPKRGHYSRGGGELTEARLSVEELRYLFFAADHSPFSEVDTLRCSNY